MLSEQKETAVPRPRALESATMAEAFQVTVAEHGARTALRTKDDEFSATWAEYGERVRAVAAGLAALGVGRGDTVGIMLTNRPEFHFADTAAMHLGATPFSLYNTSTAEQIEYLVTDAGNSVLVTEQAFLDTVLAVRDSAEALEHVIVVDGEPREGAISLTELEGRGEEGFDFEAAWRAVGPDDLATVIYTSGTTGPPKGVQLSHDNILSAFRSFDEIFRLPSEGGLISWLPMAHIAERNATHYGPIGSGVATTCCPDPRQVVAYLAEVRPVWFFAVPRVWEKLKAAMEIGIGAEPDENRRQAIEWALEVGQRMVAAEQAGEEPSAELAAEHAKAEQVLGALRERIGFDQLSWAHVGAAPCPQETIEFFHAIGVPLAELWGLSESTGAGTCNPPERIKIGTVGPAAPGAELKIAEDGEVLLRSGAVMPGYRNAPEKTAEALDDEGWLHTGDVGEIDEDGYLRIVDRKKELIINSAGKNMSPANIEAKLKAASPLIGQVCAVGDDRPYNVALIVLDPDFAPVFAQQHGIEDTSPEALAAAPAILEEVAAGVERGNAGLSRVEQVKKFKLLPTDWQPGGDELTPTMKLKRRPIAHKYEAEIEALYSD
ncbi:MAG TPA: long-chain fatty acid--CoA ligase [Solirubrobacterales bacterium]|nr:long-chain fatty acid--CoA ligase [Solirubrobacterales bacterium]